MNPLSIFSNFFQNGGPFMYVILLTGVLILGLALERFWVIGKAAAVKGDKLTGDVLRLVGQGDSAAAVELCKKVKGPAAQVAHAILTRNTRDEEKLFNAAETEAVLVLPKLSRRLPFVSILANSATLLGLLGTIFGLTTAFSAVDAADPSQRSAFLAAGISQALNTTSFGLIVAVPSLWVHGFLVSKVEGVVDDVDQISARLVKMLVRSGESAASKRKAA
ncbi:MAG: MotA/TolQ/ExbB proton channel family protein [bacterium]|nr:MotA/TolQ/ExbB proton channel family protein [bacterium]